MSRAAPSGFYATLARLIEEGRTVAVATVVRVSGSVPRRVGAKMIVAGRGETWDTIGGGSFEALVVEDALEAIAAGETRIRRYTFSEDGQDSVGQVCGGTAEVLIEPVATPDRLLIFGAGHVGRALARQSAGLGFDVTVIDDRPEALRPDLFPPSTRLIQTDPTFTEHLPRPDHRTYVAVVTRCHRTDREALSRVLAGPPARYVGLIGSRRKKLTLFRDLRAEGVPDALLDGVHSPIGLDIGAETPEEIAVSIVAELIRVRRASAKDEEPSERDLTRKV